jgi:5'-nucleotidase/UDP-sugar diphosphatase
MILAFAIFHLGNYYSISFYSFRPSNQSYMNTFKSLLLLSVLSLTTTTSAKVIQIIHTNDLHSFFAGTRGGLGGYARLKSVINDLRSEATSKGIPTLYLDGGDFGEGSSFYFSNQGVDSLRALDMLGVDITVLGNHDFILGGKQLRNQIRDAGLKATILSANTRGKSFMGLSDLMPDFKDIMIDDMKVRVFGLTTSEIHYQYPMRPLGLISNAHKAGIKMAEKAQRENVDFLVALTHIGVDADKALVKKSRTIDLVVGGHSHTKLPRPVFQANLAGRDVPVVQAGAHSMFVGSILMDVQKGGQSKLIDYRMIDIDKSVPEDQPMKEFVGNAYTNREQYFGRQWDEVIGISKIKLSGIHNGQENGHSTCWSKHIARLTRVSAETELGLQFDTFQGEEIPPGPITFGDMVDNFPHFRRWGDMGWNIARARVSGFLLKKILNLLANSDVKLAVTIDGIKTKPDGRVGTTEYDPRVHHVSEALINGEPIQSLRYYTIALPSEVPFAMEKMFSVLTDALLHELEYLEDKNYWPLLEDYIRKNSPIRCLED